MDRLIDTDKYSATLRAKCVNTHDKRILISRLEGSEQAADLTIPPNCGGLGRVRHFRRETAAEWVENPLKGWRIRRREESIAGQGLTVRGDRAPEDRHRELEEGTGRALLQRNEGTVDRAGAAPVAAPSPSGAPEILLGVDLCEPSLGKNHIGDRSSRSHAIRCRIFRSEELAKFGEV